VRDGNQEVELQVAETEEPADVERDALPYQISYYPADYTLSVYREKVHAQQIVVPPFQRKFVWDLARQSKLVESFLLGLPVPPVFLYKERGTNKLLVVDGQQRIMSMIHFFDNDFEGEPFRLKGVQPKWEGKRFEDLDDVDRLQLEDGVLRATVIQQMDKDDHDSMYLIFERLNTGGVGLSQMEIRRCLYFGHFYNLIEVLNRKEAWRQILGERDEDPRLRDQELLLRCLAMNAGWQSYEKPMKKFLSSYIIAHRFKEGPSSAPFLEETATKFESASRRVVAALGERPFHLRARLNMAVMDSVMAVFLDQGGLEGAGVAAKFARLKEDDEFLKNVEKSTSDAKVITRRFERARAILLA